METLDDRRGALFRIGAWTVDPTSCVISRGEERIRVEERTIRLLACLAERTGEVVGNNELLDRVWPGATVSQDSLYQAVASLRRLLGDDPKAPTYIATVPRRGYRLVAEVVREPPEPAESSRRGEAPSARTSAFRRLVLPALAVVLVLAGGLTFALRSTPRPPSPAPRPATAPIAKSIAVLPFLDLTSESMGEEYFADSMTEELIDRLSKLPGFHVPAPTASFYFKGRRMTVDAIAKSLNVVYVLDGSVRRSGPTLRIAARLVRGEDGFVVWSGTYDRRSADVLKIEADIADHVAMALQGVIGR